MEDGDQFVNAILIGKIDSDLVMASEGDTS